MRASFLQSTVFSMPSPRTTWLSTIAGRIAVLRSPTNTCKSCHWGQLYTRICFRLSSPQHQVRAFMQYLRLWIIVDVFATLAPPDAKNKPALIQHPDVPYTHFIVQTTGECTGEYLQLLFNTLLSATGSALASQLETAPLTPVYNFLMARDWLMMIPRTNASCNGVGVNALGMLGILWLGNSEQLQTWSTSGFDEILSHVGLRGGSGITV